MLEIQLRTRFMWCLRGGADMIKFGFVLLGIPGLTLGAVGWFARSSRPWPSTIVTKLLGTALLIIGVLVVLNIWLAI